MVPLLQDIVHDKKKLAVVAVCLLIFLYVDFTFIISGQIKAINAVKKKISTLRKDIEAFKSDSAFVKNASLSQSVPASLKKLPSEEEVPSLMQAISAIANENGVRIMKIDKSRSARQEAGSLAKSSPVKGNRAGLQTSDPATGLGQVEIRLDIVAGYHNLGNFINGIENLEKLCFIDELTINRDASNPMKQM